MEIKNVSVIKLDEITNATTKQLTRSKTTMWVCLAIVVLCSIFMIIKGDVALGITFIAIGLFFPIVTLIMRNAMAKKMNSSNQMMGNGIYYEYVFKDKSFKVSTVVGDHSSINEVSYLDLFKMQVIENMLFLFITPSNAYVVKNDGFENQSDYENLIKYFKENFASKIN